MRRNRKKNRIKYSLIAAALFVVAGAGGYIASSYYHQSGDMATSNTNGNEQISSDPKPDTQACIAALPTNMKLGQKLMLAVYSEQIDQLTPILGNLGIGGVIIMDEVSADQLARLRDAFKIAPIIAVDQEGGTVQRYTGNGALPGASDMTDLTTDQAYKLYLEDSKYLAGIGVTTNLAPVVDVESRQPSPLPGRMYSTNAKAVASYAGEAVRAMKDANIQPVIKHFPGMGSASGNTDFTSATTDPLSELLTRDIIPYQQLASMKPDVMVGNMIVPDLTNGQPAIWSPEVVKLLRQLGYETSVVYSDSLTAKAIPGTLESAALKTWVADVDVAVIVQNKNEIANIAAYVNAITSLGTSQLDSGVLDQAILNSSIERLLERKQINPCDIPITP